MVRFRDAQLRQPQFAVVLPTQKVRQSRRTVLPLCWTVSFPASSSVFRSVSGAPSFWRARVWIMRPPLVIKFKRGHACEPLSVCCSLLVALPTPSHSTPLLAGASHTGPLPLPSSREGRAHGGNIFPHGPNTSPRSYPGQRPHLLHRVRATLTPQQPQRRLVYFLPTIKSLSYQV